MEEAQKLTSRERVLLNMIGEARTNSEIADALGLRMGTVKSSIARLYQKIGARNRVAAARVVWEQEQLEQ